MSLHQAGAGHDGQDNLIEGFQQPLRGRLNRSAFGIARKQSRDLLMLLGQGVTNHALQDGYDPQGDGQEANETHAMIITLYIQRRKTTRDGL